MRVEHIKLLQVFRVFNGTAPTYLCSEFKLVSEVHNHYTRNSENKYFKPRVNSHGLNSFVSTSIIHWNGLPNYLKYIKTKDVFKNKVKTFLMETMLEEEECIYKYY